MKQISRCSRYLNEFPGMVSVAYGMAFRIDDSLLKRDASHEPVQARIGQVMDWRDALVERYPVLLRDGSGRAVGRPGVGDGWARIVVRAIGRILAAGSSTGDAVRILGIAEKYGTLRISIDVSHRSTAVAAIEEAVALAEAASECTCDICGGEGMLYESGNVLSTRCVAHGAGAPVPVSPGWENIRIVRHVKAGKVRTVSCRRYDRATDTLIDVPPSALGLDE
ncbi:hypothetical protein [Bradyrhizobium canariense]|nr:hypothetical protein [Bradyrhizobium canariense]